MRLALNWDLLLFDSIIRSTTHYYFITCFQPPLNSCFPVAFFHEEKHRQNCTNCLHSLLFVALFCFVHWFSVTPHFCFRSRTHVYNHVLLCKEFISNLKGVFPHFLYHFTSKIFSFQPYVHNWVIFWLGASKFERTYTRKIFNLQ